MGGEEEARIPYANISSSQKISDNIYIYNIDISWTIKYIFAVLDDSDCVRNQIYFVVLSCLPPTPSPHLLVVTIYIYMYFFFKYFSLLFTLYTPCSFNKIVLITLYNCIFIIDQIVYLCVNPINLFIFFFLWTYVLN